MKEFAETPRGLVTNARCLTEGVDVPDIDCVLFADPRRSAVDIVQAVGRALRPAPGKKMGYIIVPILHDPSARPGDILDSEEFKEILTTLRALAANDDRIIEYFRAISAGKRHTGGGSVEFDLDERLAKRIDLAQFTRDIDLRCWDRLARLSYKPFHEARDFARSLKLKNGDEWLAFCAGKMPGKGKLPSDIPADPHGTYAQKGWKSMGDWLGTGTVATYLREYRSFREARDFARSLKLNAVSEWWAFCTAKMPGKGRLPPDIPANPNNIYADRGWKGMGDWLGTGTIAPFLREYRPFREARRFARSLKLKSGSEWSTFGKGKMPGKEKLPTDIPANPNQTYADRGWKSMGDWLGTGTIAPRLRRYRSFREARRFARNLKLKNQDEWRAFCKGKMPGRGKLAPDIPANPNQTYADRGWKGMGDWLGTGKVATFLREYKPFREARRFVRGLKLKNQDEWRAFCKGKIPGKGKLPADIPAAPHFTYTDKGWKSMGDWLGTGTIAPRMRRFKSFREARRFVRGLKLKNQDEWRAFCKGKIPGKGKLPPDIPANPSRTYVDRGWKDMGDWLGTGTIATQLRRYRSFREARRFARSLKLKNRNEWLAFYTGKMPGKGKLPPDIPTNPNDTYADRGWKGMGDWLGTGTIAPHMRRFRPFGEARRFARNLKLKSGSEWRAFCKGKIPGKGKLPPDIPTNPNTTYADRGWKGFGDWLGTGTIAPRLRQYRPFHDARRFVRSLKLGNRPEWWAFCKGKMPGRGKLPPDIPARPDNTYADKGWNGMGDWLGVIRKREKYER